MQVSVHHVEKITSEITSYTAPHVFHSRTIRIHHGDQIDEVVIYAPTREALLFPGEPHPSTCMCIDCIPTPKDPDEDDDETELGDPVAATPLESVSAFAEATV